jgi:hypothetical protein
MSDKLPEPIGAPEGNPFLSLRQARAACRTFPSFQDAVNDAMNGSSKQKSVQMRGRENCPAKVVLNYFQWRWDFLLQFVAFINGIGAQVK